MKSISPLFALLVTTIAIAPTGASAQVVVTPAAPSGEAPLPGPTEPNVAAPTLVAPAPTAPTAVATPEQPQTLARAINLPAQQKMPESFGAPRQLVIGGSTALNVHGFHQQLQGRKDQSFSLDFSPWVGGFVTRHFLVGGQMPLSYSRGGGIWFANVGVGPFFAWSIPVSTHFGLLPRVGAAYYFGRIRTTARQAAQFGDNHAVYVNARFDAVVHLTHHVSVAFGPYATYSVLNRTGGIKQPWQTYYGLQASVLGWL